MTTQNRFKKERYITQRKGKNGWSFQVLIRTEGNTITKTFNENAYGNARSAYESAIAFKNKTLNDIVNNTVLKVKRLTVDDVFREFQESTTDSFNTKKKHELLYNKYILHKDTLIQELTKADIISDLNAMTDEATDGTINRVLSIWRKDIIQYALDNEYLIRDLTSGIRCPSSRVLTTKKDTKTDRKTILEVEDILMKSNMNRYNARMIVYLIEVLYYTGMRPAEAEALTRDDIKDDHISITKQLGSDKDEKYVATKCKTPTSVRDIPISPALRIILDDLLDYSKSYDIFTREDGRYLDSDFVGNVLNRLLKGTGIKFNLYMLRHNMATELVRNGTDTKTTMELLGHAQYNMSLGYANSSEELKDKAVQLLH